MPPTARTVKVTVTEAKLSIVPFRIKIKSAGEEVVWKCEDGTVQILFNKDGTPFSPVAFPAGAGTELHSGVCAVTTNRLYNYTMVVNRPTSTVPIMIDPEVVISDSTPPPKKGGKGKKKAAKKKAAKKSK